jgi:adenine-specific DNA-methyltransferase
MTGKKTRLELTWIGKDSRPRLEPRILLEDPELSYIGKSTPDANSIFDNRLIHGDNLLALKALEQEFAGKVKCIYIDPPYNTGSAFTHYDDGVEHSLWLSLMRDRLELLHKLLADDGLIFISIDDSNLAYLTLLMHGVFGSANFCGYIVWEKKKKPSFLDANMGGITEYILAYAKDRRRAPPFIGGVTTAGKKYPLNNAGNAPKILTFPASSIRFICKDQAFEPQDMSEGNIVTRLLDRIKVKNGRNVDVFRLEGEWRYSQAKVDEILRSGEEIIISKAPFRPNHVKAGGEPKKMKNLLSVAHFGMSTYEDATAESAALFGSDAFDYPKPEKLIETLLAAVTNPGDLVLDSFLGSGTTAAVAHKMGRRWIGIELGEHAKTHCAPRLRKVIDGADPGGVTEAVGWKGGGGFRFYRLAPSLLEQDAWGNWVISQQYNPAMLAEAMCKHEGFRYQPSQTAYWQQGRSTETDFIYVTTQTLTREQLAELSDRVGDKRSLLICCAAFRAKADAFPNLTIKKIPSAVLRRCEWGRDDYSLSIAKPEESAPSEVSEASEAASSTQSVGDASATPKKRGRPKKATAQSLPLFGETKEPS